MKETKPIPEMTKDEINLELAERLKLPLHESVQSKLPIESIKFGGDVHCTCGKTVPQFMYHNHQREANPDFYFDPGKIMLLREMQKNDSYINFAYSIRLSSLVGIERFICDQNSGFLAIAALEFLRKEQA